jgi:deoxyribodipyrimidine photo-lyase
LTSVLWFRRDLRLGDHLALAEAAAGPVVPLFVLDPALLAPAGAPRIAFLYRCLRALDESTGGRLVVRAGDPVDVVPAVAAEAEADSVLVSADFGPYGRRRDQAVAEALQAGGRRLRGVGSPYAVDPGQVVKQDGTPFQVFSPFYRMWRAHRRPAPAPAPTVEWADGLPTDGIPADPPLDATLPPAGEAAALARLDALAVDDYAEHRDRPAADATSRLSPYLKYGCIHPRTILARLGRSKAHEKFRSELAWREFYADVLWHRPKAARQSLQPAMAKMKVDAGTQANERFEAWAHGRTGYPLVDAGMRQLLAEAWMPNRVRMVVASFLVKDLHIDWTRGARWFMGHLVDGDLASNNLNWQWVAGTGTDPAPYFRVFNPATQAKDHDPDEAYVRRWEADGYPEPIVDHATERAEAIFRYESLKSRP